MRMGSKPPEPVFFRRPLPAPEAVEHLPADALQWTEISRFKRAHRVHILPAPPRLLPPATKGHGGTASSRYAGAFALGLDHMGRVFGLAPAHYFDAGVIATLWFFGTCEGIHALVNDYRGMRFLRGERKALLDAYPTACIKRGTGPRHALALRKQNRSDSLQLLYFTLLDFSSALGATILGAAELLRPALLGVFGNFMHVGMALGLAGFFPLVVPGAIGAADRGVRGLRTFHKQHQMRTYLARNPSELGALTGALFDKRQRELRTYYVLDGAARAALTVGASLSAFVGPVGLIPLVPAAIGLLITENSGRRMIRLGDVLPLQERMALKDDMCFQTEAAATYRDWSCLYDLRKTRRKRYPRGWDTPFRPLVYMWRGVRSGRKDHPLTKYAVLDALGKRSHTPTPGVRDMDAMQLLDIMRGLRMQDGFARAVLQHKPLRRALKGHGVEINGKKWAVNNYEAATFIDALRAIHGRTVRQDHIIRDYFSAAEEVVLCSGKTETMRRQRALLDLYGRFIRTQVKDPAVKAAAKVRHRHVWGRLFASKTRAPQH